MAFRAAKILAMNLCARVMHLAMWFSLPVKFWSSFLEAVVLFIHCLQSLRVSFSFSLGITTCICQTSMRRYTIALVVQAYAMEEV